MDSYGAEAQETRLRALAEEMGLKAGQLFGSLREAVTGQRVSPPLFDTMAVIGRETVLARIAAAADLLENSVEHEN
jgi:glutamyl-tRNA synthetase